MSMHALNLKVGYEKQDLRLPGNRTEAELETDRRGTRTPDDFSNLETGFANLGQISARRIRTLGRRRLQGKEKRLSFRFLGFDSRWQY